MGLDYYGILGLNRSCTNLDIKKAFRRLILHYNPERQKEESVRELFTALAGAYDCLSDSFRRAVYDQYGEEGLKRGVPGPQGYIKPYIYHGDPLRTYREFFGTESPYPDLLDVLIDPLPLYSLPEGKGIKRKEEPLRRTLYLTLSELFHGGIKKLKIRKYVLTGDFQNTTVLKEKLLTVPIKPGLPEGTEMKFIEEGDQGPTIIPADIIFVTEDRPHPLFERDGINLIMERTVTLEEALVGCTVIVQTLDHKTLRVPITEIISPTYEKVIENEGMPTVEDPNIRGNLIIKFKVVFPTYLPRASKNLIRKAMHLARIGGGKGEPEQINKLILADKIKRVTHQEGLPK
ncbi:dnaJ homolog subfamily B member 13-like [Periplaneta americana]|uniref:dnaJ homolog subfamily B member 13-like n=1 Tax=Periplaneta americana TaxID=6978 RepID=UPI0037E9BBFE